MKRPARTRADRRPAEPLRIADTLTGRPIKVGPQPGRPVRLYVCGPTVYAPAHVGHARTYLFFDVARRVLESEGHEVRHVMNVTDVEDKIDRRADALGITSRRLARLEERGFFLDLGALGVRPPTYRPRAGDYVPQMVRVGRALERTGRVRRSGDEWIYDPPEHRRGENFPTGIELARHVVEESGHPFRGGSGRDRGILVWKRQDPPLPSWPSPWGRGVPGWHLECFAMATELLGVPVDLHGGARDLVYPHHYAENEIALALRGSPFSRAFLHTGFVLQHGAKMSKSTGNLVPLRSALEQVGAGGLRWYLLGRGFRDRLPWAETDLERAVGTYRSVRETFHRWLDEARGDADLQVDESGEFVLTTLLGPEAVDALREAADALGVSPTDLLKMLLGGGLGGLPGAGVGIDPEDALKQLTGEQP